MVGAFAHDWDMVQASNTFRSAAVCSLHSQRKHILFILFNLIEFLSSHYCRRHSRHNLQSHLLFIANFRSASPVAAILSKNICHSVLTQANIKSWNVFSNASVGIGWWLSPLAHTPNTVAQTSFSQLKWTSTHTHTHTGKTKICLHLMNSCRQRMSV